MRERVLKCMVRDQVQGDQQEKLVAAFEEKGIDYALLKGASIKHLYPDSLFRAMGDIDVLIQTEQYQVIREIMIDLGYQEWRETDHELIWVKPPFMCVELHKKIVPSTNKDFYAYYGTGWKKMKKSDGCRHAMTPEDEFIYLLMHFSKHYRDGGIGIRHLVDLWIYQKTHPQLDEGYVLEELKKLRLDQFYRNVVETADAWFYGAEETVATRTITETIFQSGSYGNKEKGDYAYALRVTEEHANTFIAKLDIAWKLVFMPPSKMKVKYPTLHKKPYLLPVYWGRRWWEAVVHKRDNIRSQAKRLKRINKRDVRKYRNELRSVGLDSFGEEE